MHHYNLQSVKSVRNKKKFREKSSHRCHSTDFQNINDVWISGISGISVGKIFSVKVRTQTSQI